MTKAKLEGKSKGVASDKIAKALPLFASRPAAGFPAPGDDELERSLNIHELMVTHPDSTFFVRVEGDSMEGARIYSGDILVVDRVAPIEDGVIVVAAVFGEMVVKRLQKRKEGTYLVSENPAYQPIAISDNEDCYIWGVVTGSVRVF